MSELQAMSNHFRAVEIDIMIWLVVDLPSEEYEFVSWDSESPIWKNNVHVPNHQPVMVGKAPLTINIVLSGKIEGSVVSC